MGDWVSYVFGRFRLMHDGHITDFDDSAAFDDIEAYCAAVSHNIWGSNRNDDTPRILLNHDIPGWIHAPLSVSLSQYRYDNPVVYQFAFSAEKQEEMAALINRYGTTPTGIGRAIIQMGRNRIWRDARLTAGEQPQPKAWSKLPLAV